MFYESQCTVLFDGKKDYIDLSEHLHRFLKGGALSADIAFRTEDPGYMALLAVYYKESVLPDFSLNLNKGRATLTIRRGGGLRVLSGGAACCDGRRHQLCFRGTNRGVGVWLDGERILADEAAGPWCEFGYVGFATLGRGTLEDRFANFFCGELLSVRLSDREEALPPMEPVDRIPSQCLFQKGMGGCENFRIPAILTAGAVTIATADARMDAAGDNPNHICRAVRISRDSGATWNPIHIFADFGGTGREDGAAAIDGSLLFDAQTGTLFMLFCHTSAGIGLRQSQPGTGWSSDGRKLLWDRQDKPLVRQADGQVFAADGAAAGLTVDAYGRLFRGGEALGSVCHGKNRLLRQADTSFLMLMTSSDLGQTWSDPIDLNPQVKADWMRFLGAGPGTGIQVQEGPHRGRLIYPVYFSGDSCQLTSSGAIYSDDHGQTWKRGASVNDGRPWDGGILNARQLNIPQAVLGECQITELEGGRLKIFLRNGLGRRTCTAISDDGGESWHDLIPEQSLPDPQCQSHVLRLERAGRIYHLFSNPADPNSRVRGTVRFSQDGGKTWTHSRVVEPGEFGYSCMTQLPDGQIGLIYEDAEINMRFLKFPLEALWEASDIDG